METNENEKKKKKKTKKALQKVLKLQMLSRNQCNDFTEPTDVDMPLEIEPCRQELT